MINWIKRNKLATLLIVILLVFVAKDFFSSFFGVNLLRKSYQAPVSELGGFGDVDFSPSTGRGGVGVLPIPGREYAPAETEERLVVEESSMSMVVSAVRETSDKVVDYAKSVNGYMVSTSLTNPEEAPFATVVVRIPADNFRSALDYFRSLSVKVTSENIRGTDVTDEYVDIEARLKTLEKTKVKFEEIMDKAARIQDILNVQRELITLQNQIDTLKGRQKYLEQTAKLAKITVYLSTDELALPYAPTDRFRPKVIFKQAIRSLVRTLRDVAKILIWLGVYSIVLIPVAFIVFFIRKRKKKAS